MKLLFLRYKTNHVCTNTLTSIDFVMKKNEIVRRVWFSVKKGYQLYLPLDVSASRNVIKETIRYGRMGRDQRGTRRRNVIGV